MTTSNAKNILNLPYFDSEDEMKEVKSQNGAEQQQKEKETSRLDVLVEITLNNYLVKRTFWIRRFCSTD